MDVTSRRVTRLVTLPLLLAGLAACGTLGIGDGKKTTTPTVGNRTPVLSRIADEVKPDPDTRQRIGGAAARAAERGLAGRPQRAAEACRCAWLCRPRRYCVWTATVAGSSACRSPAARRGAGRRRRALFVVDTDGRWSTQPGRAATGVRRWSH